MLLNDFEIVRNSVTFANVWRTIAGIRLLNNYSTKFHDIEKNKLMDFTINLKNFVRVLTARTTCHMLPLFTNNCELSLSVMYSTGRCRAALRPAGSPRKTFKVGRSQGPIDRFHEMPEVKERTMSDAQSLHGFPASSTRRSRQSLDLSFQEGYSFVHIKTDN